LKIFRHGGGGFFIFETGISSLGGENRHGGGNKDINSYELL
jgi:hypothetical protein